MFQKFRENLIDEAVSGLLLQNIFRYRNHPPAYLDQAELSPDVLSGDREKFFYSVRPQVAVEPYGTPVKLSENLTRHDFHFASEVQTPFAETNRVIYSRWSDPHRPNQRVIVGVDGIVQMRDSWFRTLAEKNGAGGLGRRHDGCSLQSSENPNRLPSRAVNLEWELLPPVECGSAIDSRSQVAC